MMNIPEVAEALSVSEMTVRRLLQSGCLESFKVGRQYRVKPEAVENFITTQTQTQQLKGKTDDQ
jgi:excisionase family DNA binding protein